MAKLNPIIPARRIGAAFGLKAGCYESRAVFQQRLLRDFAELLAAKNLTGQVWADLGCATGPLMSAMQERVSAMPVIVGVDHAFDSLQRARNRGVLPVCADLDQLALKRETLDGVVVSSVLHWLAEPARSLEQAVRLLRRDGLLLVGMFTEGSYTEINRVRKECGLSSVGWYPDPDHVKDMCARAGVTVTVAHSMERVAWYGSARDVLRDISETGAAVANGPSMSRGGLEEFCSQYERLFGGNEGVPLTQKGLTILGVRT